MYISVGAVEILRLIYSRRFLFYILIISPDFKFEKVQKNVIKWLLQIFLVKKIMIVGHRAPKTSKF